MVVSKLKSLEFVILSSFEPVFIPYLKLTRHPNPTSYLPTIFLIAILPPVTPSCLKAFLFVMFFPSYISFLWHTYPRFPTFTQPMFLRPLMTCELCFYLNPFLAGNNLCIWILEIVLRILYVYELSISIWLSKKKTNK